MRYETKKGWSINDTSTLIANQHYKRYKIKKDKIKEKYDDRLFIKGQEGLTRDVKQWFREEGRKEWSKYLRELSKLMYEKDGDFQKFLWDITSEHEKDVMARRARGRLRGKYSV